MLVIGIVFLFYTTHFFLSGMLKKFQDAEIASFCKWDVHLVGRADRRFRLRYIVKVKKGKVIPVFTQTSTTPWRRIGKGKYGSAILNLSTRWRWEVSSLPQPFYPQGNSSQLPLYMRLVGHRVSLNAMEKWKIFFPPAWNQTWVLGSCLVTISTELSQLLVGYCVVNYMEFWC
jgi:hypothetical protein